MRSVPTLGPLSWGTAPLAAQVRAQRSPGILPDPTLPLPANDSAVSEHSTFSLVSGHRTDATKGGPANLMGPWLPEQTKPIYARHSWNNGGNLNADGTANAEAAELVLKEGTVFIQGGAVEGLADKASSCLQLTFKWFRKGESVCLAVHLMRENKRGNTLMTVEPRRTQGSPAIPSTFGQGGELSNKKFGVESSDPPILLGPLPVYGPRLHPALPPRSSLLQLTSWLPGTVTAPPHLPPTPSHRPHCSRLISPKPETYHDQPALGTKCKFLQWPSGALLALQARSPLHIKANAPSAFHPLPFLSPLLYRERPSHLHLRVLPSGLNLDASFLQVTRLHRVLWGAHFLCT